ncbi:hypothetical protein [Methanoregula sp.]|uniref:hypothetical protein n=1 Tax=Methanoregula sp. TaxID=2052170 RepID=UPI003BAEF0D2
MRTITLEEHYASPAFLDGPGRNLREQPGMTGRFGYGNPAEDLLDLGEKRIAEMDTAGIDMQVLSLTDPSVQQLDATGAAELAREANDYLAEAVRRYPERFARIRHTANRCSWHRCRRAGAHGYRTWLQRRMDQRPHPGPLP